MKDVFSKLYFIASESDPINNIPLIESAYNGGCRLFQLRIKNNSIDSIEQTSLQLIKFCKERNCTFILNDFLDIAKKVNADGVHLGKADVSIKIAREKSRNDFIIGATADSFETLEKSVVAGADYIGLGPFRYTTTKKNLSELIGIEGYRRIMKKYLESTLRKIPVYAIGGIDSVDINDILNTGVYGICVSSAISKSSDPINKVKELLSIIEQHNQNVR